MRVVCAIKDGHSVPREAVAERIGMSATSGHFGNTLSSLHTLGLIQYPQRGHVELVGWLR